VGCLHYVDLLQIVSSLYDGRTRDLIVQSGIMLGRFSSVKEWRCEPGCFSNKKWVSEN
jgi:hypothetical protein